MEKPGINGEERKETDRLKLKFNFRSNGQRKDLPYFGKAMKSQAKITVDLGVLLQVIKMRTSL